LGVGGEFLRSCHQSIGFAKGVLGDGVATKVRFVAMSSEQWTAPEETTVAVATGAREDDFAGRSRDNCFEVPAICEADWKRVEFGGRDDVVRDQPVLGNPARPTRRVETDQPNEAPG